MTEDRHAGVFRVELVGRYSKLPAIPVWGSPGAQYGQTGHDGQQNSRPGQHVQKVERRLETDIILQLVHDYQAGMPSTELMKTYGLGKGTVLRLLRERGVEVRRQGLSPEQITEATTLYADGWSLARIGRQFDCAHTVIRDALLKQGVIMRPRRGWQY